MWPRLSDSISIFLESWILRKSILVLYCTVLAAAVVSPAQRVSAAVCAGSAQGGGAGISPARTRISPAQPRISLHGPAALRGKQSRGVSGREAAGAELWRDGAGIPAVPSGGHCGMASAEPAAPPASRPCPPAAPPPAGLTTPELL